MASARNDDSKTTNSNFGISSSFHSLFQASSGSASNQSAAASSDDKKTGAVKNEKNLHLIWLGSTIRANHLVRLEKWKALNPEYQITVWVDEKYESAIKDQFKNKNLNAKAITALDLSKNLQELVTKFTQSRDDKLLPNYAAASDILRFKILHDFNGWYVDTDIEPVDLSKIKINPDFNFLFVGKQENEKATILAPSVMFSGSDSLLAQKGLKACESLIAILTDQYIKVIRSNQASIRCLSTMETTGGILRFVLAKIFVNGKPLIEALNMFDGKINDSNLYDTLCVNFNSNLEQSWVLSDIAPVGDGNVALKALPGITLDEEYANMMFHRPMSHSAYELFREIIRPILDSIEKTHKQISAHVSIPDLLKIHS
jgi:hypothetical protein